MEQIPHNMKHIILANMNVKVYGRRGDSVNSTFLLWSFLNLTVKNYENRSNVADVIIKIKVAHFWDTG